MRLILFDVDGTLIYSNRAGRAAMVHALEEVFGTAGPVEDYSMAGKTDPLIISELLQAAGVPAHKVENGLSRVYDLMAAQGAAIFPEKGIRPCPGVPELLQALEAREDVLLGLVTGNIEHTAPLKLAAAGIDPAQFVVGAYGSDEKDRNRLPEIAMERARRLTGYPFAGADTVVVGDTPADILCARAANATAVAVATGTHSAATLSAYSPDHLMANLADTETVLRLLLPEKERKGNG